MPPARGSSTAAERALVRLEAWAREVTFPAAPWPELGYYNWKIGVPWSLVARPTPEIAQRCAAALLLAATNAVNTRPRKHRLARVVTCISWPDMFMSEVCIFFDEAYWKDFTRRDDASDRWARLSAETSLLARLGLPLPRGCAEIGFHVSRADPDISPLDRVQESEEWLIGEVMSRRRAIH